MLTSTSATGQRARPLRHRVLAGLSVLALLCPGLAAAGEGAHEHPAPVVLAPGYADLEFVPPAPGSYALPPLGEASDGAVVDSAGQPRRMHEVLDGRIVLMSFIYTRCSDVNGCPLATHVLRGVQQRLLEDKTLAGSVRLVSISFDPEHDTPATMRRYADAFRDPGGDWRFLTCRSQTELAPLLEAYDQWVIRDYDAQGNYTGTLSHLLRVYLIDERKRIRNIYSVSFLHADTIANDIRTLLLEQS